MRGINTDINTIRQMVFSEIAQLSYDYDENDKDFFKKMEHIPYRIIPGEESTYRDSVFLERAIVNERMRLAMGLPVRKANEHAPVSDGACQGCLSHPCQIVCPKNAISFKDGRSVIDQSKCVKCGKCIDACPYHAILRQERPCVKACGAGAIGSDEYGRAEINQEKCVSCGMCLASHR